MYKLLLILCMFTIYTGANAQVRALAENGREVLLLENGTWRYVDSTDEANFRPAAAAVNPTKFTRQATSGFLVKSKVLNVGVYINPAKWQLLPKGEEKSPEYRLALKSNDAFCMMLTEKTRFELDKLRQIALANAKRVSPDVKETMAEYRTVNGKKVLCLKLEGTVDGIKFFYLGYYFSNANGTVQLVCYSSQQLFDEVKGELEILLNGFVETELRAGA